MSEAKSSSSDLRGFVIRVSILLGAVVILYVAWQVTTALLLAFAGILLAVVFHGIAVRLSAWTRLPHRWALGVVLGVLAALLLSGTYLLGNQLVTQFGELSTRATDALDRLPIDLQSVFDNARGLLSPATKWAAGFAISIGYFLLVLTVGIYVAFNPELYRTGLMLLFSPKRQARAEEVLDAIGRTLWQWLLGTLLSMLAVGILTAIGLLTLGVPAAMALAITAGLLEFIPIVGPWLAAIPAVLVALASGGWTLAAYVAILYFGIQQLENHVIYPLAQRETVSLPPALTVIAVVAFSLLFGILGTVLAIPLLVVAMVLINLLYVEDVLGRTPRLKENKARNPGPSKADPRDG